jgi:hypothetical protein
MMVLYLLGVTVTAAWASSREMAQAQELMDRWVPTSVLCTTHIDVTSFLPISIRSCGN